ncbi:MAG TPA: DUF3742 family protein [Pseudomonas sp.]|uniref:DUF3742 family protein n=1 Tax=Pseudomonas sp. TaxID=306 RepID=UPI002ED9A54A
MTTETRKNGSAAVRIGHVLGRGVGGILRSEKALWSSFSRIGAPSVIVNSVKWVVRAAVIGTFAFFAAWGLLYAFAVLAIFSIALGLVKNGGLNSGIGILQSKPSNAELREGFEGFGLYIDEVRVD